MILGQYLCELIYSTEFLNNSINSAKQNFQVDFENVLSFHEQIKLLKLIALYLALNSSKEGVGNKTPHTKSNNISSCQRTDTNL
jgi:hypothetical protein